MQKHIIRTAEWRTVSGYTVGTHIIIYNCVMLMYEKKKKSNRKPKITIIQNNTVNCNRCWCYDAGVRIQEADYSAFFENNRWMCFINFVTHTHADNIADYWTFLQPYGLLDRIYNNTVVRRILFDRNFFTRFRKHRITNEYNNTYNERRVHIVQYLCTFISFLNRKTIR